MLSVVGGWAKEEPIERKQGRKEGRKERRMKGGGDIKERRKGGNNIYGQTEGRKDGRGGGGNGAREEEERMMVVIVCSGVPMTPITSSRRFPLSMLDLQASSNFSTFIWERDVVRNAREVKMPFQARERELGVILWFQWLWWRRRWQQQWEWWWQ
jgi:hypothetical protein